MDGTRKAYGKKSKCRRSAKVVVFASRMIKKEKKKDRMVSDHSLKRGRGPARATREKKKAATERKKGSFISV